MGPKAEKNLLKPSIWAMYHVNNSSNHNGLTAAFIRLTKSVVTRMTVKIREAFFSVQMAVRSSLFKIISTFFLDADNCIDNGLV